MQVLDVVGLRQPGKGSTPRQHSVLMSHGDLYDAVTFEKQSEKKNVATSVELARAPDGGY